MTLLLAIKAFFKAWKHPKKAVDFLEDKPCKTPKEADHLTLLSLLQQSSRLIDFLKEDLTGFSDEQVGAAVRKIHQDCSKTIEELVTIRPVMEDNEGSIVQVHKDYDPKAIKVIGRVQGEAPYTGTLVHKGWKAQKRSLPRSVGEVGQDVLHPAEVEIR